MFGLANSRQAAVGLLGVDRMASPILRFARLSAVFAYAGVALLVVGVTPAFAEERIVHRSGVPPV